MKLPSLLFIKILRVDLYDIYVTSKWIFIFKNPMTKFSLNFIAVNIVYITNAT